jgi:hypothetical protein
MLEAKELPLNIHEKEDVLSKGDVLSTATSRKSSPCSLTASLIVKLRVSDGKLARHILQSHKLEQRDRHLAAAAAAAAGAGAATALPSCTRQPAMIRLGHSNC